MVYHRIIRIKIISKSYAYKSTRVQWTSFIILLIHSALLSKLSFFFFLIAIREINSLIRGIHCYYNIRWHNAQHILLLNTLRNSNVNLR